MAKHKAKTVGKNEDGTDISMYFPTFAHLVKCIVPAEGQTVKEMLLDELLAEYADEINGNTEALGKKVPLIHDAGGVRTLRDVAQTFISGGTGTMMIELPVTASQIMLVLKISGYQYTYGDKYTWELLTGGFIQGDVDTWHLSPATLTSTTKFIKRLRTGKNAATGKFCLLLNSPDFQWNHAITAVEIVHASAPMPLGDWNTSLITDESGITNIREKPVSWVATDDGVWYDMVLQNGATAHPDYRPQYRKTGNAVYLRGGIYSNTSAVVSVAVLPTGFRPAGIVRYRAMADSIDVHSDRYTTINGAGIITYTNNPGNFPGLLFSNISFIADA